MRRRILLFLILGLLAGFLYRMAKSYSLPLVNYVVCHSFLQKAPVGFPLDEAQQVFDRALRKASLSPITKGRYLQDLFRISQKLEKVQRLSSEETQELLESVRGYL